jgi:hypothetical protein
MKKKLALVAVVATLGFAAGTASAQDTLTGDTRLACEAILCLSSGTRPNECTSSIARYFSIKASKPADTFRLRLNFLQLCPVAGQSPEMQSLVSAIAGGAGNCDAQSLNATLLTSMGSGSMDSLSYSYIGNQMPGYCSVYINHIYTNLSTTGPRYIGTPERGGYWVEAQNYDSALATYNERIQREDQERAHAQTMY